MMTRLEQAAQHYLDVLNAHDGSARHGYKVNAQMGNFKTVHFVETGEHLWGGRERLRSVAEEILGVDADD